MADITVEQLEKFSSCEMTPRHWQLLQEKTEFYLNDQQFDGVVITHGTNTIEETAYYLNLTVRSEKPVVLVGSQKPPTALGTDAHSNLLNAVRVATHSSSKGKGVLVVLNDEINAAREVTKTNTYRLEAFQSGQLGFLGYVDVDSNVVYYREPVKKHTLKSPFAGIRLSSFPNVGIIYSYAGADGDFIRTIIDQKIFEGIVIAGTGACKMSKRGVRRQKQSCWQRKSC